MRLVGITGFDRQQGGRGFAARPLQAAEAVETQDAVERLGPVAEGILETAGAIPF